MNQLLLTMKKKIIGFFIVLFTTSLTIMLVNSQLKAQNELDVIQGKWLQFTDASNSMYHHLTSEAYQLLDSREAEVSELNTPGKWRERQQEMKKRMWDVIGPFPERTPLNSKTVGKVVKEGYTIENLIYESLPGFYVTASLFIPDEIDKPAPAILFCTGHSGIAYRRPLYQQPLLNLVKKGFVVLAFDPIGQGERLQYYDLEKGESIIGSSTKEHSYPSPQVALIGQSVARYFIWDGIRGIDYLVSRKEVDPERIGVHGLSGGGTQTAYISALDDRVVASAPAGYITSYRRLLESIGVQDGEQNFYHGLLNRIDHADFIQARMPKPTLIMATTNDFFSIQGVRETFTELRKVYQIFGKSDHIQLVEDDYGHGYTQKTREAMYAFFQKHLDLPGSPSEEEVAYLTEEELQKTSTGQLATSLSGETVFSLNHNFSKQQIGELQRKRRDGNDHLVSVARAARELSGYREPVNTDSPVFTGRIQKEGYVIEKYFIKGEGDYVIPYVLLVPGNRKDTSILYLHPKGKSGIIDEANEIKWLIEKGFTVLAPDLLGIGELGNGSLKGDAYINNTSYNMWYTAMLIGRSIVGIQSADVVKLARLLKQERSHVTIYGLAREEMAPVLLHSAAFDPTISKIALIKPYTSYSSFVENRFYNSGFVYSIVPGALLEYDLPDLTATLSPRKVLIAGPTDTDGKYINANQFEREYETTRASYRKNGAEAQLVILPGNVIGKPDFILEKWME